MAEKKRRGNPNWRKGFLGGGPKSSKLQVAARDDPNAIPRIVEQYLRHRTLGYSVQRAQNEVFREEFGVTTQTIGRWRVAAAVGEPVYSDVFKAIAEAEKNMREADFTELDPKLKELPYRYLEKRYLDWGADALNQEAVEEAAQEMAREKLVLVAQKMDELAAANPEMGAAELVTAAVEHLAEVK